LKEPEKAELIKTLSDVIQKAVPMAESLSKYGGTLYTLNTDLKEGQFCGLFAYENHVQLVFSQGASLDDPKALLEGKGKARRHINFASVQDIKKAAINKLLKQAASL